MLDDSFAHYLAGIGGEALHHVALPLVCIVGSQIRSVHATSGDRSSRRTVER